MRVPLPAGATLESPGTTPVAFPRISCPRTGVPNRDIAKRRPRLDPLSAARPWRSGALAVILAVTTAKFDGDGWESNPPRTPQQRPQTVLKTARLGSVTVRQSPLEFDLWLADSVVDRPRPRLSIMLAVNLAVSGPRRPGTLNPKVRVEFPG
jgi:hypothetical protein